VRAVLTNLAKGNTCSALGGAQRSAEAVATSSRSIAVDGLAATEAAAVSYIDGGRYTVRAGPLRAPAASARVRPIRMPTL